MSLTIVVPTLDEELTIGATIEHLSTVADEIIVSDGGSRDRTRDIVSRHAVTWVEGEPGRGAQLNRGAADDPADRAGATQGGATEVPRLVAVRGPTH